MPERHDRRGDDGPAYRWQDHSLSIALAGGKAIPEKREHETIRLFNQPRDAAGDTSVKESGPMAASSTSHFIAAEM